MDGKFGPRGNLHYNSEQYRELCEKAVQWFSPKFLPQEIEDAVQDLWLESYLQNKSFPVSFAQLQYRMQSRLAAREIGSRNVEVESYGLSPVGLIGDMSDELLEDRLIKREEQRNAVRLIYRALAALAPDDADRFARGWLLQPKRTSSRVCEVLLKSHQRRSLWRRFVQAFVADCPSPLCMEFREGLTSMLRKQPSSLPLPLRAHLEVCLNCQAYQRKIFGQLGFFSPWNVFVDTCAFVVKRRYFLQLFWFFGSELVQKLHRAFVVHQTVDLVVSYEGPLAYQPQPEPNDFYGYAYQPKPRPPPQCSC